MESTKTKNFIILIGSLLFSTLFYKQGIGLNLSLFTLLTILILAITNYQKIIIKSTLLKVFAYLITGFTVFLYKTDVSIIANILAYFTLVGSISEHKSSIYVKWLNGVYTTIVAGFTIYYDNINSEVDNVKKKKIDYLYWLKIIGIPTIIIIIFIKLYRAGNPMFDEIILKMDFSFINFQWILSAGLGYYLLYNITHTVTVETITSSDIKIGNNLEKCTLKYISKKKLKIEKQLSTILMFSLNALIIMFLITDVIHLSEIHKMSAAELSKQVHTGVNAIIFSNVLAVVIILYFFRGNLNFFDKIKDLKHSTFVWIFLNLSVVMITAIKNIEYIISFGLTYKRIGVLFFLTATLIGLITTFIKVSKIKNLWFLFRKNTQIAFVILIISSTINWDKIITYYNINYADQIDLKYLRKLSDNNTFLLKDYSEKNNIDMDNKLKINYKNSQYLKKLKNNSWQEMVLDNLKIK
jgi:hypothetical protein